MSSRAAVGDLVGIESDQLVFDYLSRVGDLAYGTSMASGERARLVNELRGEIDRMRAAEGGAQSKAAVRRILGRLGTPEAVVSARGGGPVSQGGLSEVVVPGPRDATMPDAGSGSLGERARARARDAREQARVRLTKQQPGDTGGSPEGDGGKSSGGTPDAERAPTLQELEKNAPHLAGIDELGTMESEPDWWRTEPGAAGAGGGRTGAGGDLVPGFTGGIELPEVLQPPPTEEEPSTPAPPPPEPEPAAEPAAVRPSVRDLVRARGRGAGGPRVGGVVELAAAVLLLAGAVTGSLIPLAAGWLAAWWSPRLRRTEAKWAVAGMPALVAVGTAVWLWGRAQRHWGERIPQGGDAMRDALADTGPVLLRLAAVASALFLLWRARRPLVR